MLGPDVGAAVVAPGEGQGAGLGDVGLEVGGRAFAAALSLLLLGLLLLVLGLAVGAGIRVVFVFCCSRFLAGVGGGGGGAVGPGLPAAGGDVAVDEAEGRGAVDEDAGGQAAGAEAVVLGGPGAVEEGAAPEGGAGARVGPGEGAVADAEEGDDVVARGHPRRAEVGGRGRDPGDGDYGAVVVAVGRGVIGVRSGGGRGADGAGLVRLGGGSRRRRRWVEVGLVVRLVVRGPGRGVIAKAILRLVGNAVDLLGGNDGGRIVGSSRRRSCFHPAISRIDRKDRGRRPRGRRIWVTVHHGCKPAAAITATTTTCNLNKLKLSLRVVLRRSKQGSVFFHHAYNSRVVIETNEVKERR